MLLHTKAVILNFLLFTIPILELQTACDSHLANLKFFQISVVFFFKFKGQGLLQKKVDSFFFILLNNQLVYL